MKKLKLKNDNVSEGKDLFLEALDNVVNKQQFTDVCIEKLQHLPIEFYDYIGIILNHLGFKTRVTREGDVNLRFDATIIDDEDSIPIEIKSPREDREINIKAIRQALENKIVLLSRHFYKTKSETSSLAIAFEYPPKRSDVYELITDIKNAFGFNIGIINIIDLLSLLYDVKKSSTVLDLNYFNTFNGMFCYEKALIKR